jgi:hypothetical protein
MKNMLDISLQEAIGPIKTLMERLTGENGKQWLIAFKRFLRKENPWADSLLFKLKIKLLRVDIEIDSDNLLKKLSLSHTEEDAKYFLSRVDPNKSTYRILGKKFGGHNTEEIVFVSVKDFGFKKDASIYDVFKKAKEHGLKTCSADTVAYLSYQCNKLEVPERIIVASEPIDEYELDYEQGSFEDENMPRILFELSNEQTIKAERSSPDTLWGPGTFFVFRV